MIDKNEPFFANCQGVGGSGKSYCIKYIAAKYKKRNVRTAYTAKAANLVFGVHLHKLFKMSYNLSSFEIMEFQKELEGVDIITIDESSFIGIKAICILDYVLKKISTIDKPFGGYKILFFGDYQQLSCVKD